MQPSVYILYGISLIAIVLGFIALLKQKTYIDTNTNKVTEVSLPFLGKFKSNYPSLFFLVIGGSLAFFVFDRSYYNSTDNTTEWNISGRLVDTSNSIENFSFGELKVIPRRIESKVSPEGKFEIVMQIKDGVKFEDEVECIDYTYRGLSVNLLTAAEKEKKEKKDNTSLLKVLGNRTRVYGKIIVNKID